MAAKTAKSPHPTAVYAKTGKGVLAFKNGTATVPAQLKEVFDCIDGKSPVAELVVQCGMEAKELEQGLDMLEEHGYVKIFSQGGEQSYSDFTEGDLDFTKAGSLLELSVREAARAKERVEGEAVQSAHTTTFAAASEPLVQPEAPAQREALEARIRDLELQIGAERAARENAEAEKEALRRSRNDVIKALVQAKALAAEERARAEEHARKAAQLELEIEAERQARAEAEARASAKR